MRLLHDFYPLWAASRLAKQGLNPYDDQAIVNTLINAGIEVNEFPGGFHYPPWTLWFFKLIGYLTLDQAIIFWLTLNIVLLILVVKLSYKLINNKFNSNNIVLTIIVSLSFLPLAKTLLIGQTTFIVFAGLLLYYLNRKNNPYISGVALSFCMLKPHLFIVIIPYWFFFHIKEKKLNVIGVMLLSLTFQFLISALTVPNIFNNFIEEISSLTIERASAIQVTVGHLLNYALNAKYFNTIIPLIASICVFVYSIKCKNFNFKTEWPLLTISIIYSPYAYSHDMILFFPLYLAVCYYFIHLNSKLSFIAIVASVIFFMIFWIKSFANFEILYLLVPIILILLIYTKREALSFLKEV